MIIGLGHKSQVGKDLVARIIQYLTSEANEDYTFEQYEEIYHLLGNNNIGYHPDWENKKFATKLKQIVCLLTGCTLNQLEDNEFKKSKLPSLWNREVLTCGCDGLGLGFPVGGKCYNCGEVTVSDSMTYRELLQQLGTNLLRRQLHSEVWVNALMSDYVCNEADDNGPIIEEHPDRSKTSYIPLSKAEPNTFPNWIISDVRFPNEFKAIKDKGGIMIRIDRNTLTNQDGQIIVSKQTRTHESETALDNEKNWDYIVDNNGTIEELIVKIKEILIKEKIL